MSNRLIGGLTHQISATPGKMRGKVEQLRNERFGGRLLQDYSFSPIDGPFQSGYYACTMYAGQRFTSFSFAAFAYRAAAQDRRASALAK